MNNPFPIFGFEKYVKPRRVFGLQTIEYDKEDNSVINIIKPCNYKYII
jgi:hypothetical protein